MEQLIIVGFFAVIVGVVVLRVRRQWKRQKSAGQKVELQPANVVALVGALIAFGGLFVLRVEGWTDTTTIDLQTGATSSSSTFGEQLAKAMVFFAIGGGLIFVAKVMAQKQIGWPPAVEQQLVRRGLVSPRQVAAMPTAAGSGAGGVQGSVRFNAPPGWPQPPVGWTPSPDWAPDPAWPPAPAGWQFWSTDTRRAE